jgi:hypothetical protein
VEPGRGRERGEPVIRSGCGKNGKYVPIHRELLRGTPDRDEAPHQARRGRLGAAIQNRGMLSEVRVGEIVYEPLPTGLARRVSRLWPSGSNREAGRGPYRLDADGYMETSKRRPAALRESRPTHGQAHRRWRGLAWLRPCPARARPALRRELLLAHVDPLGGGDQRSHIDTSW